MPTSNANKAPITVKFEKSKEGAQVVHYRETYPGGVVGTFYLSKLAMHYQWGDTPPEHINISVVPE